MIGPRGENMELLTALLLEALLATQHLVSQRRCIQRRQDGVVLGVRANLHAGLVHGPNLG